MKTRPLVIATAILSSLAGCAAQESAPISAAPTVPLEQIVQHCLATVATQGVTPTPDTLTVSQWTGYVSCAIGSNLRVDMSKIADNPAAVVEVQLDDDGSVNSMKLKGTSGNAAWDRAVKRSIAATPPLAPAPKSRNFSKIDLTYTPFQQGLGMGGGGATLTGSSHWSWRQCTRSGGAVSCD